MATEKTLNTRIKLRYDTYDAWHLANPTLLKGEVAIVELPSNPTNTDHGVIPPATLIKVGPGAFNSLPFLSATAADVHAWAKKTEDQFKEWLKTLVVTGTTNGTISVAGLDVAVKGLGSAAYTDSIAYATSAQGAKADSAVQSVALTGGTNNGTLKLTVDGTATDNIAVTGLGSAAFTEASAYATAAQGQTADAAAAKLEGIDTTVVDYVTDAIEGVTGGDITVDTAKNYDTTTGNIKTKFEAVEKAITDGIAEAKKYADDNDANDNTEYHIEYDSTGKKIKLVAGADSTKMEIDATPFIKDGMLKDVAYDASNNTLTFTWNTDGGDQTDTVVLSDILDPYTVEENAGEVQLTINGTEISADLVEGGIQSKHFATEERDIYDLSMKLVEDLRSDSYLNTSTSTVSASLKKADSAVQPGDLGTMAKEDKANYKTKQTAVTDPAANGKSLTFIDTISQNANGEISATKKNVNLDDYALKAELPTVNDGVLTVTGEDGLDGTGTFTANQAVNSEIKLGIADKGVTTAKIADHAVGAAQTKAEQGYNGADAECWVFDCGNASSHA